MVLPVSQPLGESVRRDIQDRVEGLYHFLRGTAEGSTNVMKASAPWSDRTGDARASLLCDVERKGDSNYDLITMAWGYHGDPTVPYGVFLEKSNGGVYGIVDKTVDSDLPFIRDTVKKYLTSPDRVSVFRFLDPHPD